MWTPDRLKEVARLREEMALLEESVANQELRLYEAICKHTVNAAELSRASQSNLDEKVELQRALLDLQHSIIREIEHTKMVLRRYEWDLLDLVTTPLYLEKPVPEFSGAETLKEVRDALELYDEDDARALPEYTHEGPQPENSNLKVLQRLVDGHFQDSVAFREHAKTLTEAHFIKFGVPFHEFDRESPSISFRESSNPIVTGRVILYLGLFDPSDFPAPNEAGAQVHDYAHLCILHLNSLWNLSSVVIGAV